MLWGGQSALSAAGKHGAELHSVVPASASPSVNRWHPHPLGCSLTAPLCCSQASLFLEEMASIVLTPFVLYFSLADCSHAILAFVRDHTVFVEGVGDICSLANFDFEKHGNSKYGAVTHCPKVGHCQPAFWGCT